MFKEIKDDSCPVLSGYPEITPPCGGVMVKRKHSTTRTRRDRGRLPKWAGLGTSLLVVWLGLTGCSSKPVKREDPGAVNLRKISQAYDVADLTIGHPPRSEDELKRCFKEIGETGDSDQILRSPRDGEPYVILYGPPLNSDARDIILAYEKNGAEGKRYVLTLARRVQIMTDSEFATAKFATSRGSRRTK